VSRPSIVVGDKTDHGGVVIGGASTSDANGRAIAKVGDQVTCPKKGHGGVTVIVTGDPTFIVDGKPLARHGDKTACGATLISSQAMAYVSEGSGTGSNPGASAGSEGNAPAVAAVRFEWDEQVKLVTTDGTAMMVGLPWFVRTADGRSLSGRLGDDGQLPRIDTSLEDQYEIFWGDEAIERMAGASQ